MVPDTLPSTLYVSTNFILTTHKVVMNILPVAQMRKLRGWGEVTPPKPTWCKPQNQALHSGYSIPDFVGFFTAMLLCLVGS